MTLEGKNIVVGMSGGIACYKACEAVSALTKLGACVDVIMTDNACEFVRPLTLETLSHRPVITNQFDREQPWEIEHISLAQKADLMLIMPATANVIAKFTHGIADDMLTTTYLACNAHKIICTAMNTAMLLADSTRENMDKLSKRGVQFVQGDSGALACGDVGLGRLAEPENIIAAVEEFFTNSNRLQGKTVVVTVGGTEEEIDAVRVITNRSSGKMGMAIASEALKQGATVHVIQARTKVVAPKGAAVVCVKTTQDMAREVMKYADADYMIMAAAPSDYRVLNRADKKLKSEKITLELVKNRDISADFAKIKRGKLIIFSAETENLVENASDKLWRKGADMAVANDVTLSGAGFDADTNIVSIITADGARNDYAKMSKADVAKIIIDTMVRL